MAYFKVKENPGIGLAKEAQWLRRPAGINVTIGKGAGEESA